ncbi:uncharacterized protein LOC100371544 [Saccoglossus kowalevskii]|uniref:Uncharacterized protein LOC100371544 n=1 Tax=Saccoglossus kowalevskii TaxID=10224 RepID=A0ABM0H172_SACKO|nr:PREDICTED: uncharacterized protein LOC100371544 [Saccoglossus kowalevskii]
MASKLNHIRYEIMTSEHVDEASHVLSEAFLRGHLLSIAVNQPYEVELPSNISLCKYCVQEGVSMVAIDNRIGEVVGVITGLLCHGNDIELEKPDHPMITDDILPYIMPAMKPYIWALEKNFYEYPGFNKDRDCMILVSCKIGVREDYGGIGIGTRLAELRADLCREKSIKFILASSTGIISQRLYSKLGYECIGEIPYNEFKIDGKKPFASITACPSSKLFVLEL